MASNIRACFGLQASSAALLSSRMVALRVRPCMLFNSNGLLTIAETLQPTDGQVSCLVRLGPCLLNAQATPQA